jgi:hypothetical protein
MDRVSVELRQHQAAQDAADLARETPDFADVESLVGVVNERLHAPLAKLFSTRDQILGIKRIEALNHARAVEWLLKDLENLERELRVIWENA